jgi:hypothetical protein
MTANSGDALRAVWKGFTVLGEQLREKRCYGFGSYGNGAFC